MITNIKSSGSKAQPLFKLWQPIDFSRALDIFLPGSEKCNGKQCYSPKGEMMEMFMPLIFNKKRIGEMIKKLNLVKQEHIDEMVEFMGPHILT